MFDARLLVACHFTHTHTHTQATHDENADLCACKNYHQTLRANGVPSTLVLQPAALEGCSCVGANVIGHACAQTFVGKYQSCMLLNGRLIPHAPVLTWGTCVGQSDDPAATGSPFSQFCQPHTPPPSDQCESGGRGHGGKCSFCHSHVMAFAKMVWPLVKWVVDTVGAVQDA